MFVKVQLDPTKPRAPKLKMPCEGKIHMCVARFDTVASEEVAELFGKPDKKRPVANSLIKPKFQFSLSRAHY